MEIRISKVKDLIEKLQKCNQESFVGVKELESGYHYRITNMTIDEDGGVIIECDSYI